MRKRNTEQKFVKLPTECSCCGNKVKDWESVIYECFTNYLICESCSKKEYAWWPKTGYYTIIDNYQDDMTMEKLDINPKNYF